MVKPGDLPFDSSMPGGRRNEGSRRRSVVRYEVIGRRRAVFVDSPITSASVPQAKTQNQICNQKVFKPGQRAFLGGGCPYNQLSLKGLQKSVRTCGGGQKEALLEAGAYPTTREIGRTNAAHNSRCRLLAVGVQGWADNQTAYPQRAEQS